MLIPTLVALRNLSGLFGRNSDGSLAPMFALALIPIVGAIGAGVDYSRANGIKAGLQATLDSAVLAGAKDGTSNWTQIALNYFNSNVAPKGSTVASSMTRSSLPR